MDGDDAHRPRTRKATKHVRTARTRAWQGVHGRRPWVEECHLNPDGTRKTARDTHKSTRLRERHRARTTCTIRKNH
jgi:hypothetical protein